MAKPRVFVSSTYFDQATLRTDLERFIHDLGFDAVLHERGLVPYGADHAPEEYAYREVELCDILVCIVGGKYGTQARGHDHSITQMELKRAHELGKAVYIFIDRAVYAEYRFYETNKAVPNVSYRAVDDARVHRFIEELHALPRNNPVFTFDTSRDVQELLKEQWAGLFERLLRERAAQQQGALIGDLKTALNTAQQLVTYLAEEKKQGDGVIQDILLSSHPLFQQRLATLLGVQYRVYFTSIDELSTWLLARGYKRETEFLIYDDMLEWCHSGRKAESTSFLHVQESLFDENGNLKVVRPGQWSDEWVRLEQSKGNDDDEVPF